MASVHDIVACPQCTGDAHYAFYTRTLEELLFCARCGYIEHTRPVMDRRKQKQDPQRRAWFKCRADGTPIFRTTPRAGRGAYCLAQKNGVSTVGAASRALTLRMIADFRRDTARPEIDATRSYLTRWNARRRRVEVIVGQLPNAVGLLDEVNDGNCE